MIPSWRRRFNEQWSADKYERFLGILQDECGEPTPFRHCETPVFLPAALVSRAARYGVEIAGQLLESPRYRVESRRAVPDRWRVPRDADRPLFVQADFGLDEQLEPKLVEIQGFPSLYAYQTLLAAAYREAFGIDGALASLPGGVTRDEYHGLMRRAIVADHDPAEVVLLELDPPNQKTRHDFVMTEKLYGVRTVDIRQVMKLGRDLLYSRDGRLTPIRRIYNRAIVDELERRSVELPFDFRDDLDVEWAGHPNWFFLLSKFSMPYLNHPAAPATLLLSDAGDIGEPGEWVLKPLFSFAGSGVVVSPTREQLDSVPAARRQDYILQRRVDFQPVIETPFGLTKLEIRVMYVWLDELRPVNIVIRMGRGAQMGVDHNKNMQWVGASAAFIE